MLTPKAGRKRSSQSWLSDEQSGAVTYHLLLLFQALLALQPFLLPGTPRILLALQLLLMPLPLQLLLVLQLLLALLLLHDTMLLLSLLLLLLLLPLPRLSLLLLACLLSFGFLLSLSVNRMRQLCMVTKTNVVQHWGCQEVGKEGKGRGGAGMKTGGRGGGEYRCRGNGEGGERGVQLVHAVAGAQEGGEGEGKVLAGFGEITGSGMVHRPW